MNIFKFKKKRRVIDVFTYDGAAYDLFPIQKSMEHYPKWISDLPHTIDGYNNNNGQSIPAGTLRGCPGVRDLYKIGWIVPMWSDVIIDTDER